MRRVVLLTLASVAAAAVAAANPAAAAPQQERAQMTVSFADLNLASRAGARALVSRIRIAANELCGPDVAGDLDRLAERARCVREAQAQAIQAVNRPAVTAAYQGLPQPDAVALTGSAR